MASPRIGLGLICLLAASPVFSQSPRDQFVGHEAAPYFVTLSPSKNRLASTGFDESVRLWNPETKSMISSFGEHQGIVLTAAFNHDETLLASGGLDRVIRIWDIPQSQPAQDYPMADFPVAAAAAGRGGKVLAAVSEDGKLVLWETSTQKPLKQLQTKISHPEFLAVHQDGQSVAVANEAGEMEVLSGKDWEKRTRFVAHRGGLQQLEGSSSNDYFTLGADGHFRRWPSAPEETIEWRADSPLTAAVVNTNGSQAATVNDGQKLMLWDINAQTGKPIVQELEAPLSLPRYSEDHQWLVVISRNRVPLLLQASDGKLIRSLPEFPADVTSIATSPNKRQLAAGFADGSVRIVSAENGETSGEFQSGSKPVSQLAWHHDSNQLYAVSDAGTVQLWKTQPSELTAEWSHTTKVTAVDVNSRKNRIAVGTQQGELVVLSANELKVEQEYSKQPAAIVSVDLRANADSLISSDADGVVTVWGTNRTTPLEHYFVGKQQVLSSVRLGDGSCLTVAADGSFFRQKPVAKLSFALGARPIKFFSISENMNEVALIGIDDSIVTINGNNGSDGTPYKGQSGKLTAAVFSPNSAQFYVANEQGVIFDFRTSTHQLEQVYGVGKPVSRLTVTRDSKRLLAGTDERHIRCYAVKRPERGERIKLDRISPTLQELEIPNGSLLTLAVQDDHLTGWTVMPSGQAQQWRLAAAESLARLSGHGGQVYSVAFSPDGTRLVSVSSDKSVRLWDPVTKKAIKTLATFDQVLYDVVYSPDGSSVFVCGAKRLVRQLDSETGAIKQDYEGSDETLYSLDVSSDGQRLCAAGTGLGPQRDILIWSVGNPSPMGALAMKSDSIYTVEFTESGEELFAVGYDGRVERFSVSEQKSIGVLNIPFVLYSGCLSPSGESLILATDRRELLTYPVPTSK